MFNPCRVKLIPASRRALTMKADLGAVHAALHVRPRLFESESDRVTLTPPVARQLAGTVQGGCALPCRVNYVFVMRLAQYMLHNPSAALPSPTLGSGTFTYIRTQRLVLRGKPLTLAARLTLPWLTAWKVYLSQIRACARWVDAGRRGVGAHHRALSSPR